jgi:hypothetical protein
MQGDELYFDSAEQFANTRGGKFLLIDDDTSALAAYSSTLRRQGHEVRAFTSFSEGLSCLGSEHFDLVVVKHRGVSDLNDGRFWSVKSRADAAGGACLWNAVSTGVVTWMWRTWDRRSN